MRGSAVAADKSGVSPSAISLPKGPGSIEGVGGVLPAEPQRRDGEIHSVALKVPPRTAGRTRRRKALSYEGGGGNGPLGYGWQLALPYVQRQTDGGIPTYGEDWVAREDAFINENKAELYPCRPATISAGTRALSSATGGWETTGKGHCPMAHDRSSGSAEGRVQDTNGVAPRVFACLLQRETDTHGNTIVYS